MCIIYVKKPTLYIRLWLLFLSVFLFSSNRYTFWFFAICWLHLIYDCLNAADRYLCSIFFSLVPILTCIFRCVCVVWVLCVFSILIVWNVGNLYKQKAYKIQEYRTVFNAFPVNIALFCPSISLLGSIGSLPPVQPIHLLPFLFIHVISAASPAHVIVCI